MQEFNDTLERDFWMQTYTIGLTMDFGLTIIERMQHAAAVALADQAIVALRARNKMVHGVSVSIDKVTKTSPEPDRFVDGLKRAADDMNRTPPDGSALRNGL